MRRSFFWPAVIALVLVLCFVIAFFAFTREFSYDGFMEVSYAPATATVRIKWLRYILSGDLRGTLSLQSSGSAAEYDFSGKAFDSDGMKAAFVSAYDATLNQYIVIALRFDSRLRTMEINYKATVFRSYGFGR